MKKNETLTSRKIIETIEKNKYDIRRHGVKRIGLFGSFIKKPNKNSDIDLIVRFERPTFDNYMELKFMLEKLFRKKVDLVIEQNIKPALRYIKDEAIYAKKL